jgi:hypothetical protein
MASGIWTQPLQAPFAAARAGFNVVRGAITTGTGVVGASTDPAVEPLMGNKAHVQ